MRCCLSLLPLLLAGSAAAAEPGPVLIARPQAFHTLINPPCSHCRDEARRHAADLRADDRVLCWVRGKYDGGAIPMRFFLSPYRVISDTYGVFVYDPDAGYARGFVPSLDFRFHGYRNGVMVMKHKDGTLYSCLTGLAFDGPKKGTRLQPIPTLVGAWGFWLQHYPGTVAYNLSARKYEPVDLPTTPSEDSQKSRLPTDPRLPADAPVVGVYDGQQARAYPIDDLAKVGLVHDRVDGRPRVLLWFGPTKTAAAYGETAHAPGGKGESRSVTLERDRRGGDAPFVDRETGSHWDIAGRAVDGDLKGWTLEWLDGTQVRWFAWAAEYPRTSVHGR